MEASVFRFPKEPVGHFPYILLKDTKEELLPRNAKARASQM